jgi:hypothetical protein
VSTRPSWQINQTADTVHFLSLLNPTNSTVSLTGGALSETATTLDFNFSDTTASLLNFASTNFSMGGGGLSLQFCDAGKVEGRKSIAEERPETVELARKPKGKPAPSLREISAALAEHGHVTKSGTPYAPTAVKLMLG